MPITSFPADYATSRHRFRQSAERLCWAHETHPVSADEDLTVDAAISPDDAESAIVVSSGLHGIEGFFGAAVQHALMEEWIAGPPSKSIRLILLHALNPYGFAHYRRFDADNVDPNRNFLLEGQEFAGSPPGYAELHPLLNPKRPPSRWEAFTLRAMLTVARRGMPVLKTAVATGQYDYPQGLFFGGHRPSPTRRILAANLDRWLAGCSRVVHLDFHTGLGRWGTLKLLLDYPPSDAQRQWLISTYGADAFQVSAAGGVSYPTRGSFGPWCIAKNPGRDYLYCCAEFGTYKPIAVLGGLRAENQAHNWGRPDDPSTARAKQNLGELFCPASAEWRKRTLEQARELVAKALVNLKG